jgi:hypothetical protein
LKVTTNRYFAIARFAVVALLALGLAATAHAGTRLYSGSYTVQAFGNDTTTGATVKLQRDDFSAYPFDANCHVGPYHAQETITFPTADNLNTLMFTLPRYGGQAAIHDTNADGLGDAALGCLQSQLEVGRPMLAVAQQMQTTGANTTSGATLRTAMNPRGFTIPQGHFAVTQNGSLSGDSYGPYAFDVFYSDQSNEVGVFGKNGGIGNFTWSETRVGARKEAGKVVTTKGANQFGGTMKMLGTFYSNEGFYYKGHLSVAKYSWLFQYNGAGAITSGGVVTQPGGTSAPATLYTTLSGEVYPSHVFGILFSWTTGTVSVTALHGPFPTVLARNGFDNRDAQGAGEIQMVTPMLTRWVWLSGNYETASIGHVKLNFAPEPQEWLMLAAGVSMLGLLYRSNRG